jgi:hypothetical protein
MKAWALTLSLNSCGVDLSNVALIMNTIMPQAAAADDIPSTTLALLTTKFATT